MPLFLSEIYNIQPNLKNMKIFASLFMLFLTLATLVSCSDNENKEAIIADEFIRSADISFLPIIESEGTVFYNNGVPEDMITTLKSNGCNTVRIRLWKNPTDQQSGMAEVKALSQRARAAGMKIWLTVHYSDTWADPGAQAIPAEWQGLSFEALQAAVASYTSQIMTEIQPDIIQIGNETNDGFLWPQGRLTQNEAQFISLLGAASSTIRNQSPSTKIMLHFAGINAAEWFFGKVSAVDYDYIGLSYYPMFHGKNLTALKNLINFLGETHSKKVIIAETAYPFTLGYNDFTNNIVGTEDQIIPTIPATPEGQLAFVSALRDIVESSTYGAGFSYWGGEWVAFRGPEAANGSSYENQALYNFENQALPVMRAFNLK